MLHFVFYAIVAFFLYQFVMNMDWDSAGRDASRTIGNTAGSAADSVENSSVGRTVSDSVGALRDLLP